MHTMNIFILSISLLIFTACEDKKTHTHLISKKNTTPTIKVKKTPTSYYKKSVETSIKSKIPLPSEKLNKYTLNSTQSKSYTFSLSNEKFTSEIFNHKTVVLNFVKLSSSLHLNQMASFSKIQNGYPSELTVMSISSDAEISTPNYFLAKHHISHFVSIHPENKKLLDYMQKLFHIKTLPFSIIYRNGKYFEYLKGMTPIEMIRDNIKQATQK